MPKEACRDPRSQFPAGTEINWYAPLMFIKHRKSTHVVDGIAASPLLCLDNLTYAGEMPHAVAARSWVHDPKCIATAADMDSNGQAMAREPN